MYQKFLKRLFDLIGALVAVIVLSPLFLVLIIVGTVEMKGNPFFVQPRPGKGEKIFNLIKFRSMTSETDSNGKLLPDEVRLTKYGKFLRATSLDELPELFNIIKGEMSFVGPRPLLIEYLPYYTLAERDRHKASPGVTGLAQTNGRNYICWDKRLELDVIYVNNITFKVDLIIILKTGFQFLRRQDVAVDTNKVEPNFAEERRERIRSYKE